MKKRYGKEAFMSHTRRYSTKTVARLLSSMVAAGTIGAGVLLSAGTA